MHDTSAIRTSRRPRIPAMLKAVFTSPSGLPGLIIVFLLLVLAIVGPMVWGEAAMRQDFAHVAEGPSPQFPLGTDNLGRDVLARLLSATRLSLSLALVAAAVALVLGIALGLITAVVGPRLRNILLRVIDVMIAFPSVLIVIVITVVLGKGIESVVLGVGFAYSFGFARLASTLAMSVGGREYVSSARVVGVRGTRLLMRYVLPNIAEPLTVAFSLAVTGSILTVSALSFLGLGVQAPQYDWGLMLSEGLSSIYTAPVAALAPALMIAIAALGFGLLGEAVARATNPLLWTSASKRNEAERKRSAAKLVSSNAVPDDASVFAGDDDVALSVRDLVVTYPSAKGTVDVVKGVSFDLRKGEVLGIVGESGSGKSMTALAIAQLPQFPAKVTGQVVLNGRDLNALAQRELDEVLGTSLGFVFQNPMSSLNPALRIGAQVTESIRVHGKLSRKKADQKAVQTLTEMHLAAPEKQLKRFPHELSGGMNQRVMIGKGLIKEPSLLIADEPTTALDVTVQAQIMTVLDEVNKKHDTAIILISHNLALVSQTCDRVVVMYAGNIVEELTVAQLREGPLHPYTRALLAAVPDPDHPREATLESIPGEMPDVTATPSGCAFHPRCPLAVAQCRTEIPVLESRDDNTRKVACHVANNDIHPLILETSTVVPSSV